MAASADTAAALPLTPLSSKKRKIANSTPETSKKKRRHDAAETGISTSQETIISIKERKARKQKKKEGIIEEEVLETAPETQEANHIEQPDVPAEHNSTLFEADATKTATTNGADTTYVEDDIAELDETLLRSEAPSCFYEKRLSLQLPIPAISLASSTSSLLSLHLAPLLLTYFAPADGIVLAFSDPVLSAKPSNCVNLPLQRPKPGEIPRSPMSETFASCADGFGVCWVWLTATFLVFRPDKGDELKGWTNVASEGFVGLVSYNYFQTAIGKSRIPKSWVWDGPIRETHKKVPRKGKLRDEADGDLSRDHFASTQETYNANESGVVGSGTFVDVDGNKISATQVLKVVDVEMVPGHERDRWTLQIDGSLLQAEEEEAVVAEERQRFEQVQTRSRSRSKTPGFEAGGMPLLSGTVSFSRGGSPL